VAAGQYRRFSAGLIVPVHVVTGKLGTGKTKFCVWKIQQALLAGKRVATNLDLNLRALVPSLRTATYVRVPDKPTGLSLLELGNGNPGSYDEEKNGVLVLDELGTWLNSRSFQDKSRAGVIDWMIHARKYGWDVYLIAQHENQIDRQVREALGEYTVRCFRLDKLKVPIIGGLLGLIHPRLSRLPRLHCTVTSMGVGAEHFVVERDFYRGDDLHAAYDTRQIFVEDPEAVVRTEVHPDLDVSPTVKGSWFDLLARWIGATGTRSAPAVPVRPARVGRVWPQSVLGIPPEARWEIARRAVASGRRPRWFGRIGGIDGFCS